MTRTKTLIVVITLLIIFSTTIYKVVSNKAQPVRSIELTQIKTIKPLKTQPKLGLRWLYIGNGIEYIIRDNNVLSNREIIQVIRVDSQPVQICRTIQKRCYQIISAFNGFSGTIYDKQTN